MNHNRIQSRLFKKTFRHRPDRRLQSLRTRKKARAKKIRRALQRGEFLARSTSSTKATKTKKTLPKLDGEEGSRKPNAFPSVRNPSVGPPES